MVWSHESIRDVAAIADYIEIHFGKDRADRFHDDIGRAGGALGRDFDLYTGTGFHYRGRLILKKVFHPSVIFFFADDSRETVYIIRVLRHERNWQKLIRKDFSYTFD